MKATPPLPDPLISPFDPGDPFSVAVLSQAGGDSDNPASVLREQTSASDDFSVPAMCLRCAASPLLFSPVKRETERRIREARDGLSTLVAALVALNGLDDILTEIAGDPATCAAHGFNPADASAALHTLRTAAASAGLVTTGARQRPGAAHSTAQ